MAAQGARAPVAKGGGTCIMIRTPDQRVRVIVPYDLSARLTAARPSAR
jgi:hypothetical protein